MEDSNVFINKLSLEEQSSLINAELEFAPNTSIRSAFHVDTLSGTYKLLEAYDMASLARVDMKECIQTDTTNLQSVGRQFGILDDTIFDN